MSDESIDLQVDNIRIGFGDENPAPEPTPVDRGQELRAVMEALADWLDEAEVTDEGDPYLPPATDEDIAALAQILELTQMLLWEHQNVVEQMNEFIGAMAMAKAEAVKGTKLIVANAGDAARLIKGD